MRPQNGPGDAVLPVEDNRYRLTFSTSDFVDGFEHDDLGNRLGPRADTYAHSEFRERQRKNLVLHNDVLASVFRSSAQKKRATGA